MNPNCCSAQRSPQGRTQLNKQEPEAKNKHKERVGGSSFHHWRWTDWTEMVLSDSLLGRQFPNKGYSSE